MKAELTLRMKELSLPQERSATPSRNVISLELTTSAVKMRAPLRLVVKLWSEITVKYRQKYGRCMSCKVLFLEEGHMLHSDF